MSTIATFSRRQYLLQGLLIVVLFIMAQVLASACALLQLKLSGAVPDIATSDHLMQNHSRLFIRWTAGWYVLLLLTLWLTRLCRRNCMTVGRQSGASFRLFDAVRAVSSFLLLMMGCSALTAWWDLSDAGSTALFQSISSDPVGILTLCILGPLVEEWTFREGVARQLHRSGLHAIWAAGISGLVFALAHANPAQAVPAVIMGWALGLFYFQAGDLRLCFTLHVINNTLALVLLHFPSVDAAVSTLPPHILAVTAVACLSAGGYLIYKWTIQPLRQCG